MKHIASAAQHARTESAQHKMRQLCMPSAFVPRRGRVFPESSNPRRDATFVTAHVVGIETPMQPRLVK